MPTVARLRRFDLNLLLSLHALLQFRNVTTAGKHLGVTQPTMSGDLRRLRRMLGDELLVRVGGEYQLTALARSLVGPLTELLAGIDQALTLRPNFNPRSETREFSVAMVDYALPLLFQPLAEALAREAPYVSVHTHAAHTERMVNLSVPARSRGVNAKLSIVSGTRASNPSLR
jgi:LysR family nod box-dependent transcriptional activator